MAKTTSECGGPAPASARRRTTRPAGDLPARRRRHLGPRLAARGGLAARVGLAVLVALVALVALAACGAADKSPAPPPLPDEVPPLTKDPGAVEDEPSLQPSEPPPEGTRADGAECQVGPDCQSGVCEGEGCGEDRPGRCVARIRACTKDLREYCGCDGRSFSASGSCPGQRFAGRGGCGQIPTVTLKPAGGACRVGAECDSGICEGQGCGDDTPGRCVSRSRTCTQDLRPYCGCDGKTFRASGTCPSQRYASRGGC